MRIVVWNSQGARWDDFWDYYLSQASDKDPDTVGLLVESGWAPWIASGDVKWSTMYTLPTDKEPMLNERGATRSSFCTGVRGRGGYTCWVPWQANLEGKTNTRCSMGGGVILANFLWEKKEFNDNSFLRPIIEFSFVKGKIVHFVILLVHFISSQRHAPDELKDLVKYSRQFLSEGTPAIIVGDMNINLLKIKQWPKLPANWRILRTNGATQQKGGELDWALLFDPNGRLGGSTVKVLEQFKTGNNDSDHSVLQYKLDLDT